MQAAVKDKLSLQAEVASLQKINMNLARGKDVLEARVNIHALYVTIICTLTQHTHMYQTVHGYYDSSET